MKGLLIGFLVVFITTDLWAISRKEVDAVNQTNYNSMIANLESSKKMLEKNRDQARKLKYERGEAVSNQLLSIIYYYLQDFEKGMQSSMLAIRYYEKMNQRKEIASVYTDIGFSIRTVSKEKALYYFRLALALNRTQHVGDLRVKLFNNYGTLMKESGKLDSALYYHKLSLDYCHFYRDTIGMPYSLNNMVVVFSAQKQFDKAFFYLNKSDSLRKRQNNSLNWADNLAYRADVFYDMQQTDSAVYYYEQALVLARKTRFMNLTSFCLKRLAELYEKSGRTDKALFYFKALKAQEDSLKTLETNRIMASLQEEYLTSQKEKKIVEQSLQIQRQRNTTIIFGIVFLVVVIGIGFLFYYFRKKKKIEMERLAYSKELEKTRIEKEFAEEKLRISRELHDNIGSQLTFMISSVDNLVYVEQESSKKERLNYISDFGRQTMSELRNTIWAMKHEGGDLLGLLVKLNEIKAAVSAVLNVNITHDIEEEIELPALPLLNLFRIIQEFIQNTLKYAQASEVDIHFYKNSSELVLHLKDNGKGFDATTSDLGNGLRNMQTRAEQCNGRFHLSSSSDGTCVTVSIPI